MLNPILESQLGVLETTQERKYDLLSVLTDEHLSYKLPGQNPTLGELCKEMGEIQHCYIESFKTRKLNFDYKNDDPDVSTRVNAIREWYQLLDAELMDALKALDGVDVQTETIERPHFNPPIMVNFHIFREGLLIFYGKASIYLRALDIAAPTQFQNWIG